MDAFIRVSLILSLLGFAGLAQAAVNVFACEPEWAALAKELGGDKVSVYQATTALQNPHRIEARPSLIARLRSADLLVCTGADLEVAWLPLLLRSAGNGKVQPGKPGHLLAADHVDKLEVPQRVDRSEGDVHPQGNPHIHLNPRNVARVAQMLNQRLVELDGANAASYRSRLEDFLLRWRQAIERWESNAAPLKGMKVVAYHKDEVYLMNWLGMVEVMNIEPKPGVPPSAGHLSALLTRLQAERADVIARGAYVDPKAANWLGERTGIAVVTLPYTVGGTAEAKDLFALFDDTIERLLKARKAS